MTAQAALSNTHVLNQDGLIKEITNQILTAYDQDQASDKHAPHIDLSNRKIENAHLSSALKSAFNAASHIMLNNASHDTRIKGQQLLKLNKNDTTPSKIDAEGAQFTNTSFQDMNLGNSNFQNTRHERSDLRATIAPSANTFLNAQFNNSAFTLNRFASNIMTKAEQNTNARIYSSNKAKLIYATTSDKGIIERKPSLKALLQNASMTTKSIHNTASYAHEINTSRRTYLKKQKSQQSTVPVAEPI